MTENDSRHEKGCYEAAAELRERQMRGKDRLRKHLAALSFTEKIKILEKLRDREKIIATAGLRRSPDKILGQATSEKSRWPDTTE